MQLRDAINLLAGGVDAVGPAIWADLGCGDGTFTLALAELLAAGSTIHAMDRDGSALRKIPSIHSEVRIVTHRGDFTSHPWPFADLDGILMANSLHFVKDQSAFVRRSIERTTSAGRFLIVEYDTDASSQWVPYPVSKQRLTTLFRETNDVSITFLAARASLYRRAPLYAAVIALHREPTVIRP